MGQALLQVSGIYAGYGRGDIIHGVSLEAREGEIATIIGPNGAGKSTAIKTIAGLVKLRTGSIGIGSEEIGGLPASEIARRGVSFVPQEANVFRQLTVIENLQMGAWTDREHYEERLDRVHRLFPVLKERAGVRAGNLSGGQRQMVAFGMALMVQPKVLLLDEPSAGLSPAMVGQMFETIQSVNRSGIAVLMVEQNAIQALRISQRGYVMAAGQVAIADDAEALLDSAEVSELYLGSRG
jgi:branched-chain amino acid transport system ATP-binding protein/neutral amino acid transport system ATP-binding protein